MGTVPLREGGEPIVVPAAITTFTPQHTFTPETTKTLTKNLNRLKTSTITNVKEEPKVLQSFTPEHNKHVHEKEEEKMVLKQVFCIQTLENVKLGNSKMSNLCVGLLGK